tara:strand:+ start:221 stop:955 length:735 start_codon:yes stop_codon:yes gene_type:complete
MTCGRKYAITLPSNVTGNLDFTMANEPPLEHFIRAAAHDLKGPLNRINGFAELVVRKNGDQLDAQSLEYLGIISRSVDRMSLFIDDLSHYVRTLTDDTPFESVDLNSLADAAQKSLGTMISERSAKIEVEPLPTIVGSPELLTTFFAEIFENAVVFNDATPPEVRVTATEEGNNHSVTISDNGHGIEEALLQRVTEPLLRIDKREGHSGLGLALASQIAERHKGTLRIASTPGRGTEVTFDLPK